MPKILITGNGFDLNIGLPTAYGDFINILKFAINNSDLNFESIYTQSSNHKKIIECFNDFEVNKSNIEILKSITEKNLWFQFFKDEFEIETWIDFETKIEYVLKLLFSSVEHIKEKIFSKGSINLGTQLLYTYDLFDNNIEIVEVLNKFNIIDYSNGYHIKLNKDFLIKKYDSYIGVDIDKITQYLHQELMEFKIIFNYYFETFVFPLYDNIKCEINKNLFFKIDEHYTFNYTPTFEKLYLNNNNTKFLHGRINSEENKIVLGINEVPFNTLVDQRHFFPFTKYFQKLNNNTDYAFIKEFNNDKYDNYLFFFFGHSLDKSDEDYLNEIFDFVNDLKSSTKKIIIIYHNETSKSKLLLNILNIRGKKNIEELMRSKILLFIHIDSVELLQELNSNIKRFDAMSIR